MFRNTLFEDSEMTLLTLCKIFGYGKIVGIG